MLSLRIISSKFKKKLTTPLLYKWIQKIKIYQFQITQTLITRPGVRSELKIIGVDPKKSRQ